MKLRNFVNLLLSYFRTSFLFEFADFGDKKIWILNLEFKNCRKINNLAQQRVKQKNRVKIQIIIEIYKGRKSQKWEIICSKNNDKSKWDSLAKKQKKSRKMNKNFYTKSSTKPYLIYNKKFKIEEDEICIIKADLNLLI